MKRAFAWMFLLWAASVACVADEVKIGFRLEQGYLITVRCSIGELENLTAIVDTGATGSVVDISVVRRLTLPMTADRAVFLTRQMKVFAVSIPSLRMGQMMAGPVTGIATDLHSLTSQLGIRPDVLIGMDVLGQRNLMIDYRNQQLLLTDQTVSLKNKIPLAGNTRLPMVEARIQGKHLRLHVDTGCKGILVYDPRPAALDLQGSSSLLAGGSNNFVAAATAMGHIEVGPYVISRTEVMVTRESPPAEMDGLLGPRGLRADKVALNFTNRTLSWE